MNVEKELRDFLVRRRHHKAANGVIEVYRKLGNLPKLIRAIPSQVQQEKTNYAGLIESVQRSVNLARHLSTGLPPPPELGLDTLAVERAWASQLAVVLESIRAKAPVPQGGRPRNRGEEMLALGVIGALRRGGVPEREVAAVADECLLLMGVEGGSIDRAIRSARKLTKPPQK